MKINHSFNQAMIQFINLRQWNDNFKGKLERGYMDTLHSLPS